MIYAGRQLKIVHRDIVRTKLTVSPTRISLKVSKNETRKSSQLMELAINIASQVNCDFALRGTYSEKYHTLTLSSQSGLIKMHFDTTTGKLKGQTTTFPQVNDNLH